MNLEALISSPEGFGMTEISRTQRAICRVMTGEPLEELEHDPDVVTMLGGASAVAALPSQAPDMLVLGAAVRCGKSTIVAAKALRNAYLGDCSGLAPGEVPRVAILSVDLDKARETFSKLEGALLSSPMLAQLIIKPPQNGSVTIRNRSGWPVEIKVVAGARAGKTLVSRWLLGFIADEAPRMVGEDEGVVNLDDALSAIRARMRRGAQIDLVGSLWAPRGPVFNYVTERHGRPGSDLVVMLATGPMLRPELYTPEYCERIRLADDRAFQADVMSKFADPISALLASVNVTECTRADSKIGATAGQAYVAVIDPATRGNGWTLVIIGTKMGGGYEMCVAREWIGSRAKPLKGSEVLPQIDSELKEFGITEVVTDQAGYDHLCDIAELVGVSFTLRLVNRDDDTASLKLRDMIAEKSLSLPNVTQLKTDLIAIRTRPRAAGGSQVVLIKTNDGRHCDYGAAALLGAQCLPVQDAAEVLDERDDEQRLCDRLANMNSSWDRDAASRLTGSTQWQ